MAPDTIAGASAPDLDADTCTHETLMPRWRGPDAMGDDRNALGFVCHRCHREFPPYLVQGRKLRTLLV